MKVRYLVLALGSFLLGVSCRFPESNPAGSIPVENTSVQVESEAPPSLPPPATESGDDPSFREQVSGYTTLGRDGNRLVDGWGTLPESPTVDIPLNGIPLWLVAAPLADGQDGASGTLWSVVLEDGQVQFFILEEGLVREIDSPPALTESNPPLLSHEDGKWDLLLPPDTAPALGPPAYLDAAGNWVFADGNGDLVFMNSRGVEQYRLAVKALPDGRILVDPDGRILLLTQPTERYGHGVLGDSIEAGAITLVESIPEPKVVQTIHLPESLVIEGIAPLWVDMTGDGRREIIVTQSSEEQGAQIVIYDEGGDLVASGPAIGRGYRWRHQLAVGPFGPAGEIELIDVLTPHIGGVVEYYRLSGTDLEIIAQVPGYSSHVIGSRNLDMAVAGDFDGDGNIELVLPNQERSELAGIQRTQDGAAVEWTLPLGGTLGTNLAATSVGGRVVLGAGRTDGVLRLWFSSS